MNQFDAFAAEHQDVAAACLATNILDEYRKVVRRARQKTSTLCFGRRTIPVSTIAQQFYCEQAVRLSFERPLPPTRSMRNGSAGHETVAALGAPVTQEEAISEAVVAREKPLCLYEFKIGWEHNGVTILGFVDEAWFRGGNVELVAERKFSASPGIYRPYKVQAGLYCLGLGEMGFTTEEAVYRVSVLEHGCASCERLASGECPVIAGPFANVEPCSRSGVSQVFTFDSRETTRDLDWALAFWRNERKAIPTSSPGKCRACRYRVICNFARA